MNARSQFLSFGLTTFLLWSGVAMGAITIETVHVGNPGNAADTRGAGYGSVSYAYNIGKYEVTAGQYTEFLNAVAKTDTYGLYKTAMWSPFSSHRGAKIERNGTSGSYIYSVTPEHANLPVNWVNWGDCARFANWLHNGQPTGLQALSTTEDGAYFLNGAQTNEELMAVTRKADWKWAIVSEDEWYKAAYYSPATNSYYDYPTSSNTAPGKDMTEATAPGNNANYDNTPYPVADEFITAVGTFELSASPYGTFDQGGNLWEWTEGVQYMPYHGTTYVYRCMRGGAYTLPSGYMLAGARIGNDPTYLYHDVGFRVVEVPEPASFGLLSLGGLALMRRHRAQRRSPRRLNTSRVSA